MIGNDEADIVGSDTPDRRLGYGYERSGAFKESRTADSKDRFRGVERAETVLFADVPPRSVRARVLIPAAAPHGDWSETAETQYSVLRGDQP